MRDELKLRQKVTDIIREGYLNDAKAVVIMDDILSLIEGERCVWVKDDWQMHGEDIYMTSCNMLECYDGYTFCPKCGKRIEKEEKDG